MAAIFPIKKTLAEEILIDRLAAEINDEPITFSEVMEKVQKGPLIQVSPYPATEESSQFDIALNDLINFSLILQKADELGIEVTDENLENEISSFLQKRNLDQNGLLEALKGQGMTYEQYKDDFRNQMVLSQFQGRVILPAIKITEKDLEHFYLKVSGNVAENLRLTLRQIFIAVSPDANETVKKGKEELAQQIYKKLTGGMDFKQAVEVYSNNEASRDQGGLMPPLYLKDLADPFSKAIESLKVNEFSPPIETPTGYYIFYVEKKSLAGSNDFKKKKNEIEMQLRRQEVTKQTIQWLEEQRHKSKIKIISDKKS